MSLFNQSIKISTLHSKVDDEAQYKDAFRVFSKDDEGIFFQGLNRLLNKDDQGILKMIFSQVVQWVATVS